MHITVQQFISICRVYLFVQFDCYIESLWHYNEGVNLSRYYNSHYDQANFQTFQTSATNCQIVSAIICHTVVS